MSSKKKKKIDKKISEVLIVNNKKLAPYIELVNFSFQNIDQKPLGTLLGIFEIKDTSKDSAYIVNFLASVAKKTYFAGNRKTAIDSFEATLSRINLSLSEIAKHGNVNWIGKIDAVLCSVSDNQINFSVSGDAKILLLRNERLVEISNNLSPKDEAVNPIKTFTDIASGRLKDGDKLILTTDDISHIFNLSDLENYALSFSNKKFVRFLKTALINELEIAGTIIIDAKEKTILPKKIIRPNEKTAELNAFSNKTFEFVNKKSKRKKISPAVNHSSTSANSKSKNAKKTTGHIYLKETAKDFLQTPDNKFENWLALSSEKLFQFRCWLKDRYLDKGYYKIKKFCVSLLKNTTQKTTTSIKNKSSEYVSKTKNGYHQLIKNIPAKTETTVKSITGLLPNITNLRQNFRKMNRQQKIYTLAIILFIIISPLLIAKIRNKTKSIRQQSQPISNNSTANLKINPNNNHHAEITELYQGNNLLGSFVFNGTAFVISKNKLIKLGDKNQREFPFPTYFKEAKLYSFMSDLNLLFILDEQNHLISFSPISRKFKENKINLPENSEIKAIGTYLTYIYFVDAKTNRIYRYPRAEGGFGEKVNWLKDATDLKNVSAMAIDESIFLLQNNKILKLSGGKLQPFQLNNDTNSSIKNIFTNDDLKYIYILDNLNGEIIQFDKNGHRQKYLSNQKLTEANSLWINEKNNQAYFATKNTLFKIKLDF